MKIYGSIRTVIYLVLSVLVVVFVSALAKIETLRYFIGGLMIFYGVEEIIYTAFKHEKHYCINSLYVNLVEILIGLTLIVFIETGEINVTYAVVCGSWAIWTILREASELVDATAEIKESKIIICKIVAVLDILESLAVIALSLTMLIEPGEHHAKIHLSFLAVELATKVLFPLINYLAVYFKEKKKLKIKDTGPEEASEEVAVSEEEI